MFTVRAKLASTIVFLVTAVASFAAEPNRREKPASLVSELEGVEFVQVKTLTQTGRIIAPRSDARVPKLMADLLSDESMVRIYPWCNFELVEGFPVCTWHTWNSSGIYEEDGEALRKRLVDRLAKRRFEPLPRRSHAHKVRANVL